MKQFAAMRYACPASISLIAFIALTLAPGSSAFQDSRATSEPKTTAQESKPADVRDVTLGVPIERELAGGAVHSYKVTLSAGQYLKVVVEQKGIDVVVRLFGPDGKQVTEVDSPNGMLGPEPVSLISEAAGEYRLDVKSPEEKVAAGRYQIKVEEGRTATARDRDQIGAERVLAQATVLRGQGTADSLRKAVGKYEEALPLLRKLEDRQSEATTLTSIGLVYWQIGETQKSLEYYNQAMPLRQALGDRRGEAQLLHNMGVVYWQLGDSRRALEFYTRALPVRRVAEDRQGTAVTLSAIGLANDNLGKLQEALDYYNQSLALQRDLGDRKNEITTLNNIGATYYVMGNLQRALDYYNEALPLQRALGDRRSEGFLLNNIGVAYWQLGESQKALEYYNKALLLRRATGDRTGEFTTIGNIGQVNMSSGQPHKALEYYSQGLALAREIGDRRSEGISLYNIGSAYQSLGETKKALDFLNQALLLRRAVGDRLGEALTLSQLGASFSSAREPEKALSYLEQALALHRIVGDRGGEAGTLQRIARAERDRGRLREARAQIEAAIKIVESTRSSVVSQKLRTSFSASRQSFYEFYVDVLMQMHRGEPSSGYDAVALEVSESARARSLLDILNEARADIRRGGDPVLLERERSLQQQLNARSERLTRLLGGKHTDAQATAARTEVETLLTDYQDVAAEIRARSPRYAALTQPQPLSLKEIQRLLDQETLLLEYVLGDERSYLWAVTPGSIKSFELPKRAEIESIAQRYYELVTRNENRGTQLQEEAAAALSRLLLNPVAGELVQKRLVVVSDGALQYVPFAALPVPAFNGKSQAARRKTISNKQPRGQEYQPLIVQYEIVQLPSASVLRSLRQQMAGRKPAAHMVAVVADPVFQSDDPRVRHRGMAPRETPEAATTLSDVKPHLESDLKRSVWESGLQELQRLPFSRREAEAIVALAPAGESLKALDFAANHATVTGEKIPRYRIIHFATHSLLNNVHPELSGIVLSLVDDAGRPQGGFLRLHEIYNLNLPADLVVLSGCKTALGKQIKGEGLVGLTRGFMYAGTARLVVSVWEVNDEATAELMKRFYEGMLRKGMRPAAALRAAQLEMWKSKWWNAPYYWAGFVMQGEWR